MTAAQALTSGLAAPASQARGTGGVRAERGDTSFRDTLDTAARSADRAPGNSRGETQAGQVGGNDGPNSGRRNGSDGGTGGEAPPAAAEQGGLAGLSRTLLGPAAGDGEDISAADGLQAGFGMPGSASAEGDPPVGGPWLPGQVGNDERALDVGGLFALLRSGAARGGGENVGRGAAPFFVTVTGEETHLALGSGASEMAQKLAKVQEASSVAASLSGEAKAGSAAALPAEGLLDQRLVGDDAAPGPAMEAGAARRGAAAALQTGGEGGASFDQGVGGQEGRQQDGRGSGSGMASGGAFSAAMQGTGAQGVPDPGGAAAHEPASSQIAAGVRAELRAGGIGDKSSEGVVKVLHLELKPANLGTVTVRLELKDNVITLHLETQRADTLAIIEREREALAGALSRAGYTVDTITAVPQSDTGRAGSHTANSGDGSGSFQGAADQQGQGGPTQSSGEGDDRSGRPSSGQSNAPAPSEGKDESRGFARRDVDGLYV